VNKTNFEHRLSNGTPS